MPINTNRLGIFELIGYLFSGIYLLVAAVAPFWITGRLDAVIEPVLDASVVALAAGLVISYAVGLIFSRASLSFYNGRFSCPRPETAPDSDLFGGEPHERGHPTSLEHILGALWAILRLSCPFKTYNRKSDGPADTKWRKIWCSVRDRAAGHFGVDKDDVTEGAIHQLAYSSPSGGYLDRLASIVRLSGSVALGPIVVLLAQLVLLLPLTIDGEVVSLWEDVGAVAKAWLPFAISCLAAAGGSRVALEYARQYWSAVAHGILLIEEASQAASTPRGQAAVGPEAGAEVPVRRPQDAGSSCEGPSVHDEELDLGTPYRARDNTSVRSPWVLRLRWGQGQPPRLYIPILAPPTARGRRLRDFSVLLCFRTDADDTRIAAVHVCDGEEVIGALAGIAGTSRWRVVQVPLVRAPEADRGIAIWLQVASERRDRWVQVAWAECNFLE
jgi:hypothetical protein